MLHRRRMAEFKKRRERALQLHQKGWTYGEIAAKLGISRQRVQVLCAKAKRESQPLK